MFRTAIARPNAQPTLGCPAPPPAPSRTTEPTTPHLALAVWPPSHPSLPDTYLTASQSRHRIAPELAARAVLAYTEPGDLVVDPHCGVGTVLVEAIRHGRRAVGISNKPTEAALANANISHAREQGAPARAAVLEGDPQNLPHLLTKATNILNPDRGNGPLRRHPAGSARLILTAVPTPELPELLPTFRGVLTMGGFLLLALEQRPGHARSGFGALVAAAEDSGLHYWQHVIALRADPTEPETTTARPPLLHTDVLAFRRPVPARPVAARQTAVNE